jgi:hypothetical protein
MPTPPTGSCPAVDCWANVVLQGHVLASAFRDSAVLSMVGVEHQQPIAARAVRVDHAQVHPLRQHPPLLQLQLGHLETGCNAQEIPSSGTDAAVACILVVCSNAPHSVVVASTPPFAWLYEQAGHVSRSRASLWEKPELVGRGTAGVTKAKQEDRRIVQQ